MNDLRNEKIEIIQGDSKSWEVTAVDRVANTVMDLTGFTMRFTVKENRDDLDADAVIGPITGVIAAPTSGKGVISLSKADTDVSGGTYWFDVQVDDGDDTHTIIGPTKTFYVIGDVTKTTN